MKAQEQMEHLLSKLNFDHQSAKTNELFQWTNELDRYSLPHSISEGMKERAIPTNKWWSYLHAFDPMEQTSEPIFSPPYTYHLLQYARGISMSYLAPFRVEGPIDENQAIKYYFHPAQREQWICSAKEMQENQNKLSLEGWDDAGVHLKIEPSARNQQTAQAYLKTSLMMAQAFLTIEYHDLTPLMKAETAIVMVNGKQVHPKSRVQESTNNTFVVEFNNGQVWMLFFFPEDQEPVELQFTSSTCFEATRPIRGHAQVAYLSTAAEYNYSNQKMYENHAGLFVQGGQVELRDGSEFVYRWNVQPCAGQQRRDRWMHFALEHQREILQHPKNSGASTILPYTLESPTRGVMMAISRDRSCCDWNFRFSTNMDEETSRLLSVLPPRKPSRDDITRYRLCEIVTDEIEKQDWEQAVPHGGSYYFKGKALQKFGTMCLVAQELAKEFPQMRSVAMKGITKLEKLLDIFSQNSYEFPLVYDTTYKGIISSEIFTKHDVNADFGNGVYNDHHYHFGYYIMAAAMVCVLDPEWMQERTQLREVIDTLIADVFNYQKEVGDASYVMAEKQFPRFRMFDWFLGHSYSHGVTPLADGKDEESTSEETNFFHAIALWGKYNNDQKLQNYGTLALKLNTLAIQTYFLIRDNNCTHPEKFRKNKVSGIFFDNKSDYATWFSPNRECIHGIQMIPVSPIMELVRTKEFVQEEWDQVLSKLELVQKPDVVKSGWTSLLFANYSLLDKHRAASILLDCPMDDGLSRAWAIYFACTRPN